MFEREIRYITDYTLNSIKKLGSFFTFQGLSQSRIHPAILQYISAELDYLIFLDRQRLLQKSLFDYSGAEIAKHFSYIAAEIKKNKLIPFEDARRLVQQAVTFNVNYLLRPRWSLRQFVYDTEEYRTAEEIKLLTGYAYFYDFYKVLINRFIEKKNIQSLSLNEYSDKINIITQELLTSQFDPIISNSLDDTAAFLNMGDANKTRLPVEMVEVFLKDRRLEYLIGKVRQSLSVDPKQKFEVDEYKKLIIGDKDQLRIFDFDDMPEPEVPEPPSVTLSEKAKVQAQAQLEEPLPLPTEEMDQFFEDIAEEEHEETSVFRRDDAVEPVQLSSEDYTDMLNDVLSGGTPSLIGFTLAQPPVPKPVPEIAAETEVEFNAEPELEDTFVLPPSILKPVVHESPEVIEAVEEFENLIADIPAEQDMPVQEETETPPPMDAITDALAAVEEFDSLIEEIIEAEKPVVETEESTPSILEEEGVDLPILNTMILEEIRSELQSGESETLAEDALDSLTVHLPDENENDLAEQAEIPSEDAVEKSETVETELNAVSVEEAEVAEIEPETEEVDSNITFESLLEDSEILEEPATDELTEDIAEVDTPTPEITITDELVLTDEATDDNAEDNLFEIVTETEIEPDETEDEVLFTAQELPSENASAIAIDEEDIPLFDEDADEAVEAEPEEIDEAQQLFEDVLSELSDEDEALFTVPDADPVIESFVVEEPIEVDADVADEEDLTDAAIAIDTTADKLFEVVEEDEQPSSPEMEEFEKLLSLADELSIEETAPLPVQEEDIAETEAPVLEEEAEEEEETEAELFRFFSMKETMRIVDSVFKNDSKDFVHTVEQIAQCSNFDEANDILRSVFFAYRVDPVTNREAKLFLDRVTQFFEK